MQRSAVRDHRRLAIVYRDERERLTERTCLPLAVIYYIEVTVVNKCPRSGGVVGGNSHGYYRGGWDTAQRLSARLPGHLQPFSPDGWNPRPRRAWFEGQYNHNPVATHPDQNRMRRALAQEDVFVAGADVVMTDSMGYCDVVLPSASHFEHADIYASYGHCYLQRAEPVIPRVGESLPNTEIFRRLATRFGFDDPMFRESDEVLPGVLYTPKGVWLSASPTGQTVNALLDADIRTDIEDGACCNEAFCDVARAG